MRVKKLIKTLVVCSAICICSYNMDREVFAQGTGDMSYEEGAEVYIPTAEDVELQKRKENEMLNTPMMLTEGFKTLAVTCYPQETNYYCGPATVKQVLHYLTGDNYSQGYYANLLGTTQAGTDFSRIPNVLNNRLGDSYYVYENIGE
ncbi:MAG: C39 family peptidase [Thermoflexaceae bacterium]|nr:C39 family peptidase [Thermoflexaceae bacterium]